MRLLGIVPNQVLHQDTIKVFRIIKAIGVPINKLFLYSPVKPLQVAVRLGVSGIIEEVHQAIVLAGPVKMLQEFVAIIDRILPRSRCEERLHDFE